MSWYLVNPIDDASLKALINDETTARQAADNAINALIPTQATTSNQLADKAFVNSSIQNMAARYVTPTAAGNTQWASLAALNAGPWYYSGASYTPTEHDYAIFINTDNTIWRAGYSGGQWVAQYKVNDTPFTAAQLAAINSGITEALVTKLSGIDAGANNYTHPNHSGDVTSEGDGKTTIVNNAVTTAKINNGAVTNAKMASMAANTLKGNNTSSAAAPTDLTAAEVRALLNISDGSNGANGRSIFAKSTSGNVTNISAFTGMAINDYIINTYGALTILGVSTVLGDVVQATSATGGSLVGNIRGPAGSNGTNGAPGANGTNGTNGVDGAEGLNFWTSATQISTTAGNTTSSVAVTAVTGRTVKIGDLVISSNTNSLGYYGRVTAVSSQTSVTVSTVASIRGATGATGATGITGKGISSTAITYQIGNSGTSAPTGTWSNSVQATTTTNKYLWTRIIITYTDNTTETVYSVSRRGDDGAAGGGIAEPTATGTHGRTSTPAWARVVALAGDTMTGALTIKKAAVALSSSSTYSTLFDNAHHALAPTGTGEQGGLSVGVGGNSGCGGYVQGFNSVDGVVTGAGRLRLNPAGGQVFLGNDLSKRWAQYSDGNFTVVGGNISTSDGDISASGSVIANTNIVASAAEPKIIARGSSITGILGHDYVAWVNSGTAQSVNDGSFGIMLNFASNRLYVYKRTSSGGNWQTMTWNSGGYFS